MKATSVLAAVLAIQPVYSHGGIYNYTIDGVDYAGLVSPPYMYNQECLHSQYLGTTLGFLKKAKSRYNGDGGPIPYIRFMTSSAASTVASSG